jgi:hypothetical protein
VPLATIAHEFASVIVLGIVEASRRTNSFGRTISISNQQPATSNKRPAISNQQLLTANRKPANRSS